jgi:hypothetical protein
LEQPKGQFLSRNQSRQTSSKAYQARMYFWAIFLHNGAGFFTGLATMLVLASDKRLLFLADITVSPPAPSREHFIT